MFAMYRHSICKTTQVTDQVKRTRDTYEWFEGTDTSLSETGTNFF